ncbi:MAG: nicotinate-nucleotide adenylyltransferase [Eubacteriales bacterium]|nr:nicotinate-nucleotide adenylyltransferase [Eubacteriales bacterium]
MKIGIFGGSFNPIHNSHIQLCEAASNSLGLDRLILIPTGDNPLKNEWGATRSQRLEMTEIAAAAHPDWEVSSIEVNREGMSYTVDTINELKKTMDGDFFFISGSDILFSLSKWKKIDQLAKKTWFVVAARRGVDNSRMYSVSQDLNRSLGAGIVLIEDYLVDEMSSTFIRKTVSTGGNIEEYVPAGIAEYIKRNGLYLDA